MPSTVYMVGETYGRLTVLKKEGTACTCRCTCGAETVVRMDKLRSGKTRSCGCYREEKWRARTADEKHLGLVLSAVKQRCLNPDNPAYPRYGGRGITVDPRWVESTSNFIADMGGTYRAGLTLERVDNNRGYSPDNCVWASWHQQAANRGNTLRFVDGTSVTLWARENSLDPSKAVRLFRQGHDTQQDVVANWSVRRNMKTADPVGAGVFPNGATFAGVARSRKLAVRWIAEAYYHLLFETGEPPNQKDTGRRAVDLYVGLTTALQGIE